MNILDPKGRLAFGKHRGLYPSQVPAQYIRWARENVEGFGEAIGSERGVQEPKKSLLTESPTGFSTRDRQRRLIADRMQSRETTSLRDTNPMPSDAGEPVSDRYGRENGDRRGYTKFNSDKWVPTTIHSDGSQTIHCGGPCGDLYCDEFGNT